MQRFLVDAKYVDMIEGIDALIAKCEKIIKSHKVENDNDYLHKKTVEWFIKELKALKR